jgi:hypothetical protein
MQRRVGHVLKRVGDQNMNSRFLKSFASLAVLAMLAMPSRLCAQPPPTILHKVSDGEARWKMTIDDPNVLAQINAVFVTAESARQEARLSPRQEGPAYFGSAPNHP